MLKIDHPTNPGFAKRSTLRAVDVGIQDQLVLPVYVVRDCGEGTTASISACCA
jgi:hypothetical protein